MWQIYLLLLVISSCYGLVDQNVVMVVLNHLVTLDTRLDGYTAFNYQNTTTEEYLSHDISSKPLFTSVHEAFFNGDTYKAYNNLIMFYKNPDVDVRETITSAWEDSISYFLDTVMKTPVMKSAHQFLVQKGLTTSETASFKNLLHSLWFDLYARNNETGSSGFESAFAGEVQGNNVIRFNNWLRFHQQEKLGLINYYGWFNKADSVHILLQFSWYQWNNVKSSMLLNTSPEFELAVYTICALTGGQCEMTINGHNVTITAKTIRRNGSLMIDQCCPSISSSKKHYGHSKKKHTEDDPGLQALVDEMRASDVDKANPDDYTLSWGKEESNEPHNVPLFTYVNETLFQRPAYSTLITVFQEKLFTPEVCSDEPEMTGFRKAQLQQVFNTWTNTSVFNLAFNYLHQKGYERAHDIDALKEFLWNLWFGTYSRCDGPLGSSGWEHVFIGEWKDRIVDGQHNWQRYYLLQKSNLIRYYGYYSHVANLTGTFKYKWDSETKRKGGFLIGTSPAFDFSLLTVCALIHPGENGCQYSIDGHPLGVTSYTQPCGAGTCLSTAYPTN